MSTPRTTAERAASDDTDLIDACRTVIARLAGENLHYEIEIARLRGKVHDEQMAYKALVDRLANHAECYEETECASLTGSTDIFAVARIAAFTDASAWLRETIMVAVSGSQFKNR